MQEPASVLFSVFNFIGHFYGYRRIQDQLSPTLSNRWMYTAVSIFGMNTWIWSSVFHSRDVDWTEKLDYFSAMASILFAACFAFIRIFNLESRSKLVLLIVAFVYFIAHVTYLSLWKFDYTYNMIACITVGLSSYVAWIGWYLVNSITLSTNSPLTFTRAKSREKEEFKAYAYKINILIVGMLSVMMFEVLDFPPLWHLIDAQ